MRNQAGTQVSERAGGTQGKVDTTLPHVLGLILQGDRADLELSRIIIRDEGRASSISVYGGRGSSEEGWGCVSSARTPA
jgi:hypothetical protein